MLTRAGVIDIRCWQPRCQRQVWFRALGIGFVRAPRMTVRKLAAVSFLLLAGCWSDGVSNAPSPAATTWFSFLVNAPPPPGPTTIAGICEPVVDIDDDCTVPCVLLVEYLGETDQAAGCTDPGMSQPDAMVLAAAHRSLSEALGVGSPLPVVCAYQQLSGGAASSLARRSGCTNQAPDYQGLTCADDPNVGAGWCVVADYANTGVCAQTVVFTQAGPPLGTVLTMTCLE
jgi:hypothetical protein